MEITLKNAFYLSVKCSVREYLIELSFIIITIMFKFCNYKTK